MSALRIRTDENVNPAIAAGLRLRGVDALAAVEVGNLGFTDEQQLEYATRENAVLFTHDTDLLVIAGQWARASRSHGGIVYAHLERLSVGECIRRLKEFADTVQAEDMVDRIDYL